MVWSVLTSPGIVSANGFGPPSLNRAEILRRLDCRVPSWFVDGLLDAYEHRLLTVLANKEKQKPKGRKNTVSSD